jgi:hypothetical protein
MSILYGTDIQALFDLPDPEITCSEDVTGAYACARRWLTPINALNDIGEVEQYDSINVPDWLGSSVDLNDQTVINDLQAQATQVLLEEPFAANCAVTVTFAAGSLTLTAQVQGSTGPLFQLVIANGVAGVTAALLLPGQV